jgi:phenylalanine-4-hydroxylase
MTPPTPNVPAHLRRFVVEQDYGQYNAMDQAVWRFVLLQTHARLIETAHPAYKDGLSATGISVERIPSIAEMNEKLARFGWGAVCVDGFIPPRAFQEFQAAGLLPIAADIRTRGHLVYTPAPDIIHEAAGHAPILPDPVFSSYVRRIGELGRKAFTLPEEGRVYDAIYALSELKEDPSVSSEQLRGAEEALRVALESVPEASEATKLSRLYWWTAEYGLVGRVDDYKLYGAGLLSSLWESHSCHAAEVRKLPLDEACLDVAYDITRPQPQLFVTRDFEALHELLSRVEASLSATVGGERSLSLARASGELSSIEFDSGVWALGVLRAFGPDPAQPAWLELDGPVAFAWQGRIAPLFAGLLRPERQIVVTGPLLGHGALPELDEADLDRLRRASSARHEFRFVSGAVVSGRLERSGRGPDGRLTHVELADAHVSLPGRAPLELARYVLLAAGNVRGAQAGAIDGEYHPDTAFSLVKVPKARRLPERELSLLALYERAGSAHAAGAHALGAEFPSVAARLDNDYPDEWLLRWNLLESLIKIGDSGALARKLWAELEQLEAKFERREPIASGLSYLSRWVA